MLLWFGEKVANLMDPALLSSTIGEGLCVAVCDIFVCTVGRTSVSC